jgi:hypothetical protein
MTNIAELPRWSHDEEVTASNLYEQGVIASDIADTVNRLYQHGRTTVAVRRRMHQLGVVWGSCAENDTDRERARRKTTWGRKVGHARVENRAAAERRKPWHPLHDPKPAWLRRRK